MDFLIWLLLPVLVAASTALLTYVLMRDRIEIAVSRERLLTREAQVLLRAQFETAEERVRAAEELAKRQLLEKFLIPAFQTAAVNTEARLLK